jgi:glutathione S-transferase
MRKIMPKVIHRISVSGSPHLHLIVSCLFVLSLLVMPRETHAQAGAAAAIPPITVYHIEGRRSERIIWFMEELGVPYKLSFVPGDLAASMQAIGNLNGMRMAPTVTVGDVTLIESSVIMEYLLEHYGDGKLMPARSSADYWLYRRFMYFAEGSAMPRILPTFFTKWQHMATDFPYVPRDGFVTVMSYLESELSHRPYLGGAQFTAADIMMFYPLKLAKFSLDGFSTYPNVDAYYKRITERPAFKRAIAEANPKGALPGLAP